MDGLTEFEGVGVSLGGQPVLRDVDLRLEPGSVTGVSGPNGSGKTTLVRTLATLQSIDAGRATILGQDVARSDLVSTRRKIGLIGHTPGLIPELTLVENLTHVAKLAGVEVSRVMPALEIVGLDEAADRPAAAASFGMQRRVEVAHLMLRKPMLLLLDEAMSGLDESAADLIGALIDSTAERGGTSVVVSHDSDHLSELCEVVLALEGGKLGAPA